MQEVLPMLTQSPDKPHLDRGYALCVKRKAVSDSDPPSWQTCSRTRAQSHVRSSKSARQSDSGVLRHEDEDVAVSPLLLGDDRRNSFHLHSGDSTSTAKPEIRTGRSS